MPSDLDATTNSESSRDYSSLLGTDDYEDASYDYSRLEGRTHQSAEMRDRSGSGTGGGRTGYRALAGTVGDEPGGRSDLFTVEEDDLGVGKSH